MASPIDQFQIISYFSLILGRTEIPFTNSALAMLLGSALQFVLLWALPRYSNFFKSTAELYCDFIADIVFGCAGKKADFLLPFASAIFSTIFFGNIIGLVPNIFTFTSHLLPNLLLGAIVLASVVLVGFWKNGFEFLYVFWPRGISPFINVMIMAIELTSFLMRPISLCLRLSINMIVGHVMMKVFLILAKDFGRAGIVIAPMYIFVLFFEVFVAFLQAYIFTVMTCVYLQDAVESHH